jgi:hypothetical protein
VTRKLFVFRHFVRRSTACVVQFPLLKTVQLLHQTPLRRLKSPVSHTLPVTVSIS